MWEKIPEKLCKYNNHEIKNIIDLSLECESFCALRIYFLFEVCSSFIKSEPFLDLNLWGMYECIKFINSVYKLKVSDEEKVK